MNVSGVVSYASQEPWLFPSTIKQNIIFGEPFDLERYNKTINVCALQADLDLFPEGDETVVIDKGLNLSRGQQARVNLARAVYRKADVYLLDDCLSSLDTHVSTFIFDNCVKNFLGDKMCIVITHQRQFLKQMDKIVVLKRGYVENIVTSEEVDKIQLNIDGLDSKEDKKEEMKVSKDAEDEADEEDDPLLKSDKVGIYHEEKKEGKVDLKIYKLYARNAGGFFMVAVIAVTFTACQVSSSWFDYFVSEW